MMGSFLTRGLVLVLGYAYPAYECFKTVEKNKPEIDQLRFWCQYWILVAVLTVSERVGDTFISWLPMYSEAKLAFFVYLWYPKTRGTTYVYDSFLRPYVAKHETEIDRSLMELRTRAGDMAVIYWQKAASYAQTRTFEIFQYVASQSHSRPRATQHQQPQASVPTSPPAPPSTRPQPQQALPRQASTSTTTVKTIQQHEATQDVAPPVVAPSETAGSQASKTAPSEPEVSTPSAPSCSDEPVQVETMIATVDRSADPPPPETLMEESIRVTRGRPRKTRAAANRLSR